MKVKISAHAYERWLEHVGYIKKSQLAAKVERHLYEALKQGIELINDSLLVWIEKNIYAVITPDKYGGWAVKTFREWEELQWKEYTKNVR